jgi:hypothetical protein
VIAPVAVVFMVLAVAAALALGFGVRAWTEHTSAPTVHTVVVYPQSSAAPQPVCRVAHPC